MKYLLVIVAIFAIWTLFTMAIKFVLSAALFAGLVYFGYKGVKKYLWK